MLACRNNFVQITYDSQFAQLSRVPQPNHGAAAGDIHHRQYITLYNNADIFLVQISAVGNASTEGSRVIQLG